MLAYIPFYITILERGSVCGDGLTPLDGTDCKSSRCPATYECKQGLCCPMGTIVSDINPNFA